MHLTERGRYLVGTLLLCFPLLLCLPLPSLPFYLSCSPLLSLSSVGIITTGKECTKSLPFCSFCGWTGKINWEQEIRGSGMARSFIRKKRVNKPPVAETGKLRLRGKQPRWRHQTNQPALNLRVAAEALSAGQIPGWLVNAPQRRGESQGKMKSWLKTVEGTVKGL